MIRLAKYNRYRPFYQRAVTVTFASETYLAFLRKHNSRIFIFCLSAVYFFKSCCFKHLLFFCTDISMAKFLGLVPVSYVVKRLGEKSLVMRHHGLGPDGTKPLASALLVSVTH